MGLIKICCLLLLFVLGCNNVQEFSEVTSEESNQFIQQDSVDVIDYRHEMRSFIIGLGKHAKTINPDFNIIPQNGIELVTISGEATGEISSEYLDLIDGNGQEDLFYGYKKDNVGTPKRISERLVTYLEISQKEDNTIFVIDYCSDTEDVRVSKSKNKALGFTSFAAPERNLTVIPELNGIPQKQKSKNIETLDDANNFLFFLNYENFETKESVIDAISESDYDIIFMDMFFSNGTPFSKNMIQQLKIKSNGSSRMVIAYMSIGEAEDYRFYWNTNWATEEPNWLSDENKNWSGNFKVKYWEKEWQNIIYGSPDSYLDKIVASGYNGVYLDIVDAFEYFEN